MTKPKAYLGIDVGGSSLRMMLQVGEDPRSDILSEPIPSTYSDFLALVQSMVITLGQTQLTGVGCGLPGATDFETPLFMPALPWLEGKALRYDLASMLGAEVTLGVDGHFTLLAEAFEGAAKGHSSSALVAVGTGIGGAIMINGRIWRGHTGTAGSWGWIPLSGARGQDGHGAFELMGSGSALSRRAAGLVPPMDAVDLIEAARTGIEFALREVNEFALVLGEGLAVVASAFDPGILIIGGGLSAAVDVLSEGIRKSLLQCASPNTRDVLVVPAALGPTAGVVGALLAARSEESLWL